MTDSITYLHCKKCLAEKPANETPSDYARLDLGVSATGHVVVWCNRHDELVASLSPQKIAEIAATQPCDECGENHGKGHTH